MDCSFSFSRPFLWATSSWIAASLPTSGQNADARPSLRRKFFLLSAALSSAKLALKADFSNGKAGLPLLFHPLWGKTTEAFQHGQGWSRSSQSSSFDSCPLLFAGVSSQVARALRSPHFSVGGARKQQARSFLSARPLAGWPRDHSAFPAVSSYCCPSRLGAASGAASLVSQTFTFSSLASGARFGAVLTSCVATANESAETLQGFLCARGVAVAAWPPRLWSWGFADEREAADTSVASRFPQPPLHLPLPILAPQ